MSDTLDGAIADLERRIAAEKAHRYPNMKLLYRMTERFAELKLRQLNHQNMQVEIAKHIGWIEQLDEDLTHYGVRQ